MNTFVIYFIYVIVLAFAEIIYISHYALLGKSKGIANIYYEVSGQNQHRTQDVWNAASRLVYSTSEEWCSHGFMVIITSPLLNILDGEETVYNKSIFFFVFYKMKQKTKVIKLQSFHLMKPFLLYLRKQAYSCYTFNVVAVRI